MSNRRCLRLCAVFALSTLLAAPLAAVPSRTFGSSYFGWFGDLVQVLVDFATGPKSGDQPPISDEGGGTDPGGVPGKK
jgi:hypothetical protein